MRKERTTSSHNLATRRNFLKSLEFPGNLDMILSKICKCYVEIRFFDRYFLIRLSMYVCKNIM